LDKEAELSSMQATVKANQTKQKQIEAKMTTLNSDLDSVNLKLKASLENENRLNAELQEERNNIDEAFRTIRLKDEEIQGLREDVEALKVQTSNLTVENTEQQQRIESAELEVSEMKKVIETNEEEISTLHDDYKQLDGFYNEISDELKQQKVIEFDKSLF
jgi:chromosome segregation ATPase